MPELANPACPRCAYDLSGFVESWQNACPLDGTCSECGLEFRWREVFFPGEVRVRGFYEHAKGIAFISAWRTWSWTLLPWVFWRKVRSAHPVRVRRLLPWLVVLLLPLQFLHAGHVMGLVCQSPSTATAGGTLWLNRPGNSGLQTQAISYIYPSSRDWESCIPEALDPILCRGFGYPVSWPPYATPRGPGRVTAAVLLAQARPGPLFALPLLTLSIMLPLVLLALPHTRAKAGLHFTHVLRAAIYSLSWIVMLGVVRFADEAWFWIKWLSEGRPQQIPMLGGIPLLPGLFPPRTLSGHVQAHPNLVILTVTIWLTCWWACALRNGARMHAWLMVLVAMLVPSAIMMLGGYALFVIINRGVIHSSPW